MWCKAGVRGADGALGAAGFLTAPGLLCGVLLCAGMMLLPAKATAQAKSRPTRVRVKMDGFDIAPKAGKSPNQVGGASRGLGNVVLYAPRMGRVYTLLPTFFWRADDPKGEYLFKLAPASSPNSPLLETKVVGGSFIYPATAPALVPGANYIWSVQPTIDLLGGPASGGFVVVNGPERTSIAAALAQADAAPDPELARAKVYMDKRLWFDAVAAYTNLIKEHPDRHDLYETRSEIYEQLPQTSVLADADAAKANP